MDNARPEFSGLVFYAMHASAFVSPCDLRSHARMDQFQKL
jgi:hypothetical protein